MKQLGIKVGVAAITQHEALNSGLLISRSNRESRAFAGRAPSEFTSGVPLQDADLEVRAFAAAIGIVEDPVTGSLNASLAQWLIGAGKMPAHYVASQGQALGRQGRVHIQQDSQGQVWVGGDTVKPKSVVRDLYERSMTFGEYVSHYKLKLSEGVVLRYLSDVYKGLLQNVADEYGTDEIDDLTAWLGYTTEGVRVTLERVCPFDEAESLAYGDAVTLTRDGTKFFQGTCRRVPKSADAAEEGHGYLIEDAWADLEKTTYASVGRPAYLLTVSSSSVRTCV